MTASVSGILLRIATRDAGGQGTFPAWVLRWMMAMILHTTVPTGGGGGDKEHGHHRNTVMVGFLQLPWVSVSLASPSTGFAASSCCWFSCCSARAYWPAQVLTRH